jgi:alcohol dehydrogenase (cytochrome c)
VLGRFDGGTFGYDGGLSSGISVIDPTTGELKQRKEMPYANTAGALATAGGIVVTALIEGTVVALDDQTLEELWSFNVGTGINAPPMTYANTSRSRPASPAIPWAGLPPLRRNAISARARR